MEERIMLSSVKDVAERRILPLLRLVLPVLRPICDQNNLQSFSVDGQTTSADFAPVWQISLPSGRRVTDVVHFCR